MLITRCCQNDQCNESWRTQEDVCKEAVWWYKTQGGTGSLCIGQDTLMAGYKIRNVYIIIIMIITE